MSVVASADFNLINLSCVISIGVDCLLIIIMLLLLYNLFS